MKTQGILYGVGVGPGDPELLTIKAYNCIKKSDVIVLPSKAIETCYAYQIAAQIYPEINQKEILCRDFPMIKDKEKLKAIHDNIYLEIKKYLEDGKSVAILTIGDPAVYSTYTYMQKRAAADAKRIETVSGVPSFCAACAKLGISLGESSQQIHIIPSSYEIEESLKLSGTKVYMKAGKKLKELKELLMAEKRRNNMEIYAVSNCGMPQEKVCYGLEELEEMEGYLTLVIVKEC